MKSPTSCESMNWSRQRWLFSTTKGVNESLHFVWVAGPTSAMGQQLLPRLYGCRCLWLQISEHYCPDNSVRYPDTKLTASRSIFLSVFMFIYASMPLSVVLWVLPELKRTNEWINKWISRQFRLGPKVSGHMALFGMRSSNEIHRNELSQWLRYDDGTLSWLFNLLQPLLYFTSVFLSFFFIRRISAKTAERPLGAKYDRRKKGVTACHAYGKELSISFGQTYEGRSKSFEPNICTEETDSWAYIYFSTWSQPLSMLNL